MGPDNNKELFETAAQPSLASVGEEFLRRNVVTPVLTDLSAQFESYPPSPGPLTEPTILLKLHALSRVQLSRMGVAGFEPTAVFSHERHMVKVEATPAPHHDEFRSTAGEVVRTRVCRLHMADEDYGESVELFAINVYTPDPKLETDDPEPAATPSFVVVGKGNRPVGKSAPITGETVIFAVRNRDTGDAKLYRVTLRNADQTIIAPGSGVEYRDTGAIVALPGGLSAEVTVLSGELQRQMVNELNAACDALKGAQRDTLSDEERRAVSELGD